MLLVPPEFVMTDEQRDHWRRACTEMNVLESSSSDENPWLFHGTSQRNALQIVSDGFNPRTSYVFVYDAIDSLNSGHMQDCVFWTNSVRSALNYASRKSNGGYEGFPVVFAARASDLAHTGRLLPDYNTWNFNTDCDPKYWPTDWHSSLSRLSAVAVAECTSVPNLRLFAPTDINIVPERSAIVDSFPRYVRTFTPVEEPEGQTGMAFR